MNRGRDHPRGGNAMQRFDNVAFKATKTDEGFIRDTPIVGRTGILVYRNADGTERREYRPPEEAHSLVSLFRTYYLGRYMWKSAKLCG